MESVYFKTFGCSNNDAEGEIMKGIASQQYHITETIEDAEVVVLNICTVKGDDAALSQVRKVKEQYPTKFLVVAGCVTRNIIPRIRDIDPEAGILTTHHIDKINEVIQDTLEQKHIALIKPRVDFPKLSFPRIRKHKHIAIIPISNSCYGECTFCSVKRIKGKYYSYPLEHIVEEVKKAVQEGCKEIWLTSQDNACYGMDTNQTLTDLLKAVVEVEGNFKVRVGMMNPDYIERELSQLIEIFTHPKLFKFLHICLQAGSNKVLEDMKRPYTVEHFNHVVETFRKTIPKMTIATDIIVGYPTETEGDFQQTLDFVETMKPQVVNISKFRKRPGTKAAHLNPLNTKIVKDRSKRLTELFEKVSKEANAEWLGWKGKVLVDEQGKESMLGRNDYYKQVLCQGNIGEEKEVEIIETGTYHLRAKEEVIPLQLS